MEILPWIGRSCSRNNFSILVVSPNKEFTENLSKALSSIHLERNNKWQLSVHNSNDIASILQHLTKIGPMSLDFVIICMDTSTIQCIDWTKNVIRQCHSDLRPGRMILVNGSGLPVLQMAILPDDIVAIKREYKLQLMHGNLILDSECEHIARRLHIVIETVMGLKLGLPCIVNSVS